MQQAVEQFARLKLDSEQLVSAARLNDEPLPGAVREAQRYLPADDAPAPSIGTLDVLGLARATNHFMLAAPTLLTDVDYRRF